MAVVVALGVLAVLSAAALALALAVRNKRAYTKSNELIPGTRSVAPASWAGSHDPEARLHRRLVAALAALRANQAFDHDGTLLDIRVELEQQAVEVDQQLVATAALPMHLRTEPLGRLTAAVESLEQAVADLAGSSAADTSARLSRALDDVRARTGLVAQARAALDELPPIEPTATLDPGVVPDPGTGPAGADPDTGAGSAEGQAGGSS
ncbi:MAG: hypothetical protein KF703_16440 [Actinobacteria bacterium]|nr:hypothetical protein [Actinomycetota bacterium]